MDSSNSAHETLQSENALVQYEERIPRVPPCALFVPQSDHGIQARCPTGWQIARAESRGQQNDCYAKKPDRIVRRDSVQKTSESSRNSQSCSQTGDQSDEDWYHALCYHPAQNLSSYRAQRDSQADIASPAGDCVADDAVDTDCCQKQRDERKQQRQS